MWIELIEIIGYIKNDTGINGKAFLFNVTKEDINFDCILFIHENIEPFVSLHEDDNYDKNEILKAIFEKYTLTQLFEA
ncbi:MAG: hypothetical protein E6R13_05345 [Spirochaetes bacterium]|nr:MAG: hypothetical protein E6R13_05345 [Spirochaetota bacterium]